MHILYGPVEKHFVPTAEIARLEQLLDRMGVTASATLNFHQALAGDDSSRGIRILNPVGKNGVELTVQDYNGGRCCHAILTSKTSPASWLADELKKLVADPSADVAPPTGGASAEGEASERVSTPPNSGRVPGHGFTKNVEAMNRFFSALRGAYGASPFTKDQAATVLSTITDSRLPLKIVTALVAQGRLIAGEGDSYTAPSGDIVLSKKAKGVPGRPRGQQKAAKAPKAVKAKKARKAKKAKLKAAPSEATRPVKRRKRRKAKAASATPARKPQPTPTALSSDDPFMLRVKRLEAAAHVEVKKREALAAKRADLGRLIEQQTELSARIDALTAQIANGEAELLGETGLESFDALLQSLEPKASAEPTPAPEAAQGEVAPEQSSETPVAESDPVATAA